MSYSMQDTDNGGGFACMGTSIMWEISTPYVQFCCETKFSKKQSLIKIKNKTQRFISYKQCIHNVMIKCLLVEDLHLSYSFMP